MYTPYIMCHMSKRYIKFPFLVTYSKFSPYSYTAAFPLTFCFRQCKELEGLRSCHDRRAKRMQALQASQALLEEQLRTYTTETRR